MLFLFDVCIISMTAIEKKLYKSMLTPFTAIAFVYFLLINLNNLVIANIYGYYKVSSQALTMLLGLFAVIFCVSLLCRAFAGNIRSTRQTFDIATRMSSRTIIVLFFIGLIAYFLSAIINLNTFGFGNIKGENNGLFGHVSSFGFIFAPVLLYKFSKTKYQKYCIFAIIVLLGISFLFASKYVICINLIYLFICYFSGIKTNPTKRFKIICFLGFCGIFLFLILYGLIPSVRKSFGDQSVTTSVIFAIEHFFYYLLSPIIANNYSLTHLKQGGAEIVFAVPINIFQAVFGDKIYVNPIHNFDFGYAEGHYTNVSGLLGESVYCLGAPLAILCLAMLFLAIYILYINYRKSGKYKLTSGFLLAMLVFSFFCNFFTVSGIVLPTMYAFIFETYFQTFRRSAREKKVSGYYLKLERHG